MCEVFGPVNAPFYSIRFERPEELARLNLHPGDAVLAATARCEFLATASLMKAKWTDASGEHDEELTHLPPPLRIS